MRRVTSGGAKLAASACGFVLATVMAAPAAAQRDSLPRQPQDPNATVFVDLSAGRPAQPPGAAAKLSDGFIDLGGRAQPQPPKIPGQVTIGNLTIVGDYDANMPVNIDLTTNPGDRITIEAPRQKLSASSVPQVDPGDPFEQTNRSVFKSHMALHRNVVVPVERVYTDTVPEPVRFSLHNFLLNLEFPAIFVNDSLQLSPGRAGTTLVRFVVNSTVGIGGLLDPASHFGLPFHDNDFGATLANYGVGDYPYLMVPVIGPTNPRDMTGKVVDIFLNPLHYVAVPGGILTDIGENGARELDKRAQNYEELEQISDTDPDPYATVRRMSRDHRNAEAGGSDYSVVQ